ncbi:MAG: tyrosine-type recombinase/integrase [candidate division Zixibacteria bacterium]|nr:tyrosine-type recombinase/integrase [candidate division Zixibacteria bacterium]
MRVFKRGRNWYADYAIGGKRKMRSFGPHKKMAELFVKDLELRSLRGELGLLDDNISLEKFIKKYLEHSQLSKAHHTYETDLTRFKVLRRFFEEREVDKLTDITPRLMEDFKSIILQRSKPSTFNRYLEMVKAMLNRAVEWKNLKENPLKGFKKLKNPGQQEARYLSKAEIEKILDVADPFMQKVIKILLYTGMRRSELVYLTWEDVDFDNKRVRIQSKPESGFHTKSYRPRSVSMNPEFEKLFLDLPQQGKFVFDDGKGRPLHHPDTYTYWFARIVKKAGVSGVSLHCLRHTFASYLVMGGVDLRTVQELLGHSTLTVTEQYSHLSPDHRAKAVGVLDFETKLKQLEPNSSPAPAKSLPFK